MAKALIEIEFKYEGHPKFFIDMPELVAKRIKGELGSIEVEKKRLVEISLI